jgi:DNA sulfur modification protein DndB
MNTWANAKFGGSRTLETRDEPTIEVPVVCKNDHTYRTFDIFVNESLFGGITGHAVNRELNIRLEQRFSEKTLNHATLARKTMQDKVDAVIESKNLDISPYVEPVPQPEESAQEISRRIQARNEEESRQHRLNQSFTFDACVGVQAGSLFFTAVIEFSVVAKLFDIDIKKQSPEERYQRVPSGARVRNLASYVTNNQDSYILPSLTCAIEGAYDFERYGPRTKAGVLTVHPGAKFHLLDGSHRKGAIAKVVQELAKLGCEQIAVTFVLDRGLKTRRQWFSDINLNAQKPPKALSLDYNRRDREGNFHRDVIDEIPLFAKYTERSKGSAAGKNSQNLFVLTWLHNANKLLRPNISYETDFNYCVAFWNALVEIIPDWHNYDPTSPSNPAPETVREKLCCTAIGIKALAQLGEQMVGRFGERPDEIKAFLAPLAKIQWSKSAPDWQGLIVESGKILTKNLPQFLAYLKFKLKESGVTVTLTQEEQNWVAHLQEETPVQSDASTNKPPKPPATAKRQSKPRSTKTATKT